MSLEKIVSASEANGQLHLWNFDPSKWLNDDLPIEGTNKRQRTTMKRVESTASINTGFGVTALKWTTADSILAAGTDHQLKIVDLGSSSVQETIFTHHKIITAMDATSDFVVAGQEDGVVKIYDLRKQNKAQALQQYQCHERRVSQVRINPAATNVFMTAGLDGKIRLYDMRQPEEPLHQLKRQKASDVDKVFALAWNGASQILSGGTDGNISVHQI